MANLTNSSANPPMYGVVWMGFRQEWNLWTSFEGIVDNSWLMEDVMGTNFWAGKCGEIYSQGWFLATILDCLRTMIHSNFVHSEMQGTSYWQRIGLMASSVRWDFHMGEHKLAKRTHYFICGCFINLTMTLNHIKKNVTYRWTWTNMWIVVHCKQRKQFATYWVNLCNTWGET